MRALGNYDTVRAFALFMNPRQTIGFLCVWFFSQARANFVSRQKMGRLGSAEEVASMFVYLASDEVSVCRFAVHRLAVKTITVCF